MGARMARSGRPISCSAMATGTNLVPDRCVCPFIYVPMNAQYHGCRIVLLYSMNIVRWVKSGSPSSQWGHNNQPVHEIQQLIPIK